jgi:tRNA-uridine 2-sulfurtransferase
MLKGCKVFVGMSGGVDSSVAALLLRRQGHDVIGVFMRCYNLDGCAERDAEDARRVAEHIGIPFYVWDFEEEYKRRVVDYMIDGYRAGITPNPDVMCNREIKFGLFLEKAFAMGADFVATGHYVKIKKTLKAGQASSALFVARDKNKDQSYFLWTLTQKQLAHCLFPIGDYVKPEVRAIAARAGLPTAAKKDSQGICFIGDINLADFLKQSIPERRGALVTTTGERIGEHFGSEFYTIGQRHIDADFKFPKTGQTGAATGGAHREPFYVASKDVATNTVVVAKGSENKALYTKEAELANVNFLNDESNYKSSNILSNSVFARVRYRQPLAVVKLSQLENGNYKLIFAKPQKFVAQGQSAVWYLETGEMLGGGIIFSADRQIPQLMLY